MFFTLNPFICQFFLLYKFIVLLHFIENSNPDFQMISPFSWSQSVALIPNETRFVASFFCLLISTKGSPHSIGRGLSETAGLQLESLRLRSQNGRVEISRHSLFLGKFPIGCRR